MRFVVRLTYTPQAIQAMIRSPDDREAMARNILEKSGARLISRHVSPPTENGGWEALVIYDAPDPETHFALCSVVQSSGAFSSISTNRLMTSDEFMNALRKASGIQGWHMPGQAGR